MATIVLKNGSKREFQRVEYDDTGGSVVAYEDHREVESFPAFHVGSILYEDGRVYIEDEPGE
ncbi:hypothetical protein [Halorubrum halophilum]|uniref:hypothetical protein n=1 Tax=Halorubrum halophilum TaxID=413816 RepID=UPI000678EC83|nr:hypothetical protein [Halorubrum halophilum]